MRIETERLVMRPWAERDVDPFAEINGDPEVMRFFERTLTRTESASLIEWLKPKHADDFDHPMVPDGHSLKRHVLYRLASADWPGRGRSDAPDAAGR